MKLTIFTVCYRMNKIVILNNLKLLNILKNRRKEAPQASVGAILIFFARYLKREKVFITNKACGEDLLIAKDSMP